MTLLALAFTALTALEPTQAAAAPAPVVETPQSQAQDPQGGVVDLGEVVVTGQRPRGSVQGDISPDIVLDAEQLRAYGAGNIAELLQALEPLTRSNRGRADAGPILLVNGRRISGFREIQGIPFEAIERTEILPEEVALTYGYTADQRVVNFVLKAQFRAVTAQGIVRGPTQGGRISTEVESNLFRIQDGDRWSFDLERQDDGALYEDERDITRLDSAGREATPEASAYRTLLAKRSENSASGSLTRDLNSTTSGTLRASIEDSTSESFLGLPRIAIVPAGSPFLPAGSAFPQDVYLDRPDTLDRTVDTLEFEAATVLDGFIGDYRWTFNGNYNRTETETQTGRGFNSAALQTAVSAGTTNPFDAFPDTLLTPFPDDTARSVSSLLSGELVLAGDLFDLPAGGVNGTVTVGADTRSLDSESFRTGVTTETSLSRDRYRIQGNLTAPLTNRNREVLGGFGDLSANVNFGYEELSDFGGLTTIGGGLNWTPVEPLSFVASVTMEEAAPTIQQLNDPTILTPNVQVFDFATGQTVTVTRTDGGNRDLVSDSRTVWKLGVNFKPFSAQDLTFSSNYTASEIEDQVASFPTITPDLEAAFPDRFTRDISGRLVAFDARAVNYSSAERQELRTGFNFSRAFGTPNAAAANLPGGPGARFGGPGGGPRGPGGGGPRGPGGGGGSFTVGQGGPGGGGRGRGAAQLPGQGRFNLSIYHTVRFQDEITIRDNLPVIDLLDGGAVGGRGGQSQNEIQVQGGVFRNGFGSFLNASWREGTRVDGATDAQDIFFSDQTTVNLNAFLDFNQRANLLAKFPWLKNARVNVGVQNLFDSRLEVTNAAGIEPVGYQRDQLDPLGRVVSINLRKLF